MAAPATETAAAAAAAVVNSSNTGNAGGKRKSRSEGEDDNNNNSNNSNNSNNNNNRAGSEQAASPAPSSSRSSTTKPQQIRHRASIACASCRERRIRCVVPEGETECSQCRRTGSTCIIKDDDERRRPISKAYMSSLSNRIALLEEMLRERGVVPPPAVHPPKTRHEAQQARLREEQLRAQQQQQQLNGSSTTNHTTNPESQTSSNPPPPTQPAQPPTPPGSGDEDVLMAEFDPSHAFPAATAHFNRLVDPLLLQDSSSSSTIPAPAAAAEPRKDASSGARQLLVSRGIFVPDPPVAGRTRFFGPTANSHVHARTACVLGALEPHERAQHRASLVIATLPAATHDYLLRRFWEGYNAWQPVVEQSGFERGRVSKDPRLYSPFLHLAMLAVGYRFADWEREDVKRLALGGNHHRESTLHREARAMVEMEIERPGGVPSVQALLVLAELECGVGRDAAGWMYSGMANRLAFDLGLHVNPPSDVSEIERQTRRQAMSACVMFDRRWALFLGRPTSIKMQDVRVDVMLRTCSPAGSALDVGLVAARQAIHKQMFELLELAGRVADFQNTISGGAHVFASKAAEDRAYLHFVGLERLFHNWYRRLPENLAWKPVNIQTAQAGFFLLHLQFHACMIILHRPWAKYGPILSSLHGTSVGGGARYPSPESPSTEDSATTAVPFVSSWMAPTATMTPHDNRAAMSRSMCTQHAIRIARIFWHHRQRFDGRRVPLAATQHAGTAALALMAALAHKSAELDHHSNLQYLQVLSAAIYDMSHLYQPAARMYQLLKAMMGEIRNEMVKTAGLDFGSFVMGRYPPVPASGVVYGGGAGSGVGHAHRASWSGSVLPAQDDDRAAKRRRLSSVASIDYSATFMPSPSLLAASSLHAPCPSPPASAKGLECNPFAPVDPGNTTAQPPHVPVTAGFDMDFFQTSFADILGTSATSSVSAPPVPTNVAVPGSHAWAAAGQDTSPVMLIPTVSGDLSCLSTGGSGSSSTVKNSPGSATTATPSVPTTASGAGSTTTADQCDDDDSADPDKTIEDWLAEPSTKLPPAGTSVVESSSSPSNTTTTSTTAAASTTTNPAEKANPSPQQQDQQHQLTHDRATSLSHATVDGTPICRDPYVLSLQTELGIGYGLGPDEQQRHKTGGVDDASCSVLSPAATHTSDTIIVGGVGGTGSSADAGGISHLPPVPGLDMSAVGVGVGGVDLAAAAAAAMDLHLHSLEGLDGLDGIDAMDWFAAATGQDSHDHGNNAQDKAQSPTQTTTGQQGPDNHVASPTTTTTTTTQPADSPAENKPSPSSSTTPTVTNTNTNTTTTTPPPAPSTSSSTSVLPVTPITLDELAQSVEEAVGSARARARAKAAAAAAAAAAAQSAASVNVESQTSGSGAAGVVASAA
ncbi:hypothetical protein VTJ04DRAFT_7255 [Mycothermus thermophilus]|uniref:uncharacterized protein n=1 Tax=Humicola insolens TaxID=85995 RepID=UPI003742E46E